VHISGVYCNPLLSVTLNWMMARGKGPTAKKMDGIQDAMEWTRVWTNKATQLMQGRQKWRVCVYCVIMPCDLLKCVVYKHTTYLQTLHWRIVYYVTTLWICVWFAEESPISASVVISEQDQNWRSSSSADIWHCRPASITCTGCTGLYHQQTSCFIANTFWLFGQIPCILSNYSH